MKYFVCTTLVLFAIFLSWTQGFKLVCYYDITSSGRVGPAKLTSKEMELALSFCTHIVYNYVTITNELCLTVQAPERQKELANVINFKKKYPKVKFLFSISGANNWKTTNSFFEILEHGRAKKMFIKSIIEILTKYKFDGISLDIPLLTQQPIQTCTYFGKMWQKVIHFFKRKPEKDSKAMEHKNQLTTLIQQISSHLRERNAILALNVLPNVDFKKYYDIAEIIKNLDFVILSAFDFYTPKRNPKEADLMAPTKPLETNDNYLPLGNLYKYGNSKQVSRFNYNRLPLTNIKDLYKYWHSQDVPRHKIVIGVAAYGRAWKMTKDSNINGVPPIFYTDGPAAAGPQTQRPGFLSWPEICEKLLRDPKLRRVTDRKAKSGVYAFRPADSRGNYGIWISYEDHITAAAKAEYIRNHNLGGVALFDLSLDDIHGVCGGEKFPILRSINFRLSRSLT
ncbi:chitinase-like protein Idgf3 [Calliphora vicina]|uniref:chitinase-like protein Idgf3 n=1 Tax=Calliphora vicina TaxID=7373 RepID=UPI00325B6AE3